MQQDQNRRTGRVYLVGAGPGNPGLITLRGVECLGRSDLVLYECLVNPATLTHAPPTAKTVCLGKITARGIQRHLSQEQINAQLVETARRGLTVAYLKGGDPAVFSRTAGEIEALRAANIPFEVVPGVTAATAAAGYAEIPITHDGHSSAVALVAGRQPRGSTGPPLDYAALARFPGTLIFYMAVESAEHWTDALIGGGKSPETAVAVISACSRPDQQTIRCTLGTLVRVIAERQPDRPAIIIVGQVAALAPQVPWFAQRALCGVRILLTRPRGQLISLWQRLTELGAGVLVQPAIQIADPADWKPVDDVLGHLDRYDWLVFSSANGVRYLLERLFHVGGDLRQLGKLKLAAIGPATAERLAKYHLRADLIPSAYRAEALADALVAETGGRGSFLLARASRGRDVLPERLSAAGAAVEQVVVYSSTDVERVEPEVAAAMTDGRIDWVMVTSSAIARSLVALFGEQLRQTKLASISPVTSETIRHLGHEPAAEATQYTTEGLVEAILQARGE